MNVIEFLSLNNMKIIFIYSFFYLVYVMGIQMNLHFVASLDSEKKQIIFTKKYN